MLTFSLCKNTLKFVNTVSVFDPCSDEKNWNLDDCTAWLICRFSLLWENTQIDKKAGRGKMQLSIIILLLCVVLQQVVAFPRGGGGRGGGGRGGGGRGGGGRSTTWGSHVRGGGGRRGGNWFRFSTTPGGWRGVNLRQGPIVGKKWEPRNLVAAFFRPLRKIEKTQKSEICLTKLNFCSGKSKKIQFLEEKSFFQLWSGGAPNWPRWQTLAGGWTYTTARDFTSGSSGWRWDVAAAIADLWMVEW